MWPVIYLTPAFKLYPYDLLTHLGFLLGASYFWRRRKALGLSGGKTLAGLAGAYLAVWFGARVLFVWSQWDRYYQGQFWSGVLGRSGGYMFAGGILGLIAFGCIFAFWSKTPFLKLADAAGPGAALGQSLGRLGCFAQGCCYGRPTELPWGIRFFDRHSDVDPIYRGIALHPTQLYDFLAKLGLFFFLHLYSQRSKRYRMETQNRRYGRVLALYLLIHGIIRNWMEGFFRGDDRGSLFAGLTASQWTSLLLAGGSLIFLLKRET